MRYCKITPWKPILVLIIYFSRTELNIFFLNSIRLEQAVTRRTFTLLPFFSFNLVPVTIS